MSEPDDTPTGSTATAPPPPPAPTPPRLVRDREHRVLFGVAAGVAAYLGVDVVLVRVAFVLLAFAGGAGIVLYVALAVLAPLDVPGGVAVGARRRDASFWVAVGLFVLAALLVVDGVPDVGLLAAVLLVGGGVVLWRRDDTLVPSGSAAAASTWSAAAHDGISSPPRAPHAAAVPAPSPPSPPRPRSSLGPYTLAAALFTWALLAALDVGGVSVPAGVIPSAVLLVVGGGLLVGAWVGRARWLVLPALLLVPVVLVAGVVSRTDPEWVRGGIGERNVVVTSLAELEPEYRLMVGVLQVDLAALDVPDDERVDVAVAATFGQVVVTVPDDVTVELRADIGGAGELVVFDESVFNGSELDQTYRYPGRPGAGTVVLDASVVLGEIDIVREDATTTLGASS